MKKIKILILTFGFFLLLAAPALASITVSSSEVKFTPQETIPGSEFQQGTGVNVVQSTQGKYTSSNLLARYVSAFYNWGLSIVGVIAVLMLMAGGITWITSGGDSGRIAAAKKMIGSSIGGAVLLIGAWFLLNTINPDLINLPAIELSKIDRQDLDIDDHIIDDEKNLPSDAQIKWVCMNNEDQNCTDTNPPTLDVNVNICRKQLGEHGSCPFNLIHCCALSASANKKSSSLCQGKSDGTSCKPTETSTNDKGYCSNNSCQTCKISGTACSSNYECANSIMTCSKSAASDTGQASSCNYGYCQGSDAAANESCGANNSGKCYPTSFFTCPSGTSWLRGGTNCKSGLKCCR